jgi:pimeloyl-ACP methyl ester carboxylesterase
VTGHPPPDSYDVAGPESAPAIVFVHGTRLTRSSWTPQVEALRDTFRVVAMDLPGHGALADRPFSMQAGSDELARVIESAAGGRAIVVGLSLGGYIGMDLAATRPDLVRGLVLSGATQEPVGLRSTPYLALAWLMDRLDGPALDGLNAWFFQTRFPPAIADPIVAGGFFGAGGAGALRALIGQRFAPRLAAYDGPVLILNGELDVLFRMGADGFARAARDVRRVRLGGATHLANLDRPEAFNVAVRRFAEELQNRP